MAALAGCGAQEPLPTGSVADEPSYEQPARMISRARITPSASVAPVMREGQAAVRQRTEFVVRVSPAAQLLIATQLEGPFELAFPELDLASLRSSDRGAVEEVALGRAAAAVVVGEITDRDRSQGLCSLTLGYHLLALVVPAESPVRSLTSEQVRGILGGPISEWSEVAYLRGPIELLLGPEGPLMQHASTLLIPGDPFAKSAERLASERSVVEHVSRRAHALGVVDWRHVVGNPEVRAVAVNGVLPSERAVRIGSYAHGAPLQLVYPCYPGEGARALIEFVESPHGTELRKETLSVP